MNTVSIDASGARRLAYAGVLGQAVTTGIVALVCGVIAGQLAARSALLGGGISTFASFAMALVAFGRKAMADAQRAVLAFFLGEIVKLAVLIVLFVVVLKVIDVLPLPLFGAFIATIAVNWIVLARIARARN